MGPPAWNSSDDRWNSAAMAALNLMFLSPASSLRRGNRNRRLFNKRRRALPCPEPQPCGTDQFKIG